MKVNSTNNPNVDLVMNGTTPKGISKMLNKPLSTVYNVIKHFQITGCVKRKPSSDLKKSVRTPLLIKTVKGRIYFLIKHLGCCI